MPEQEQANVRPVTPGSFGYPPSSRAPDANLLPSTTQACKCPVFSLYSANTCHSKFSPFSRHEHSENTQCCIVLGAQIVGVHIANVLFSSSSPPREPSPFRELNRGDQFSGLLLLCSGEYIYINSGTGTRTL